MIPIAIDDIPGKLAALESALIAFFPGYHIYRGCTPLCDRPDDELKDGVLNIIVDREHAYKTGLRLAAKEGSLVVLLIGYLLVDEKTQDRGELQDAEAAMAEAIKSFVKGHGIREMDIVIDQVRLSRQLEYPYGWIIATLNLDPPGANVY